VAWLGLLPLKIAIAAQQAPLPEAMLILGGSPAREQAGAKIAGYHPDLRVWVSTGQMPEDVISTFQTAGVEPDRVILDYRATDTVTNFTTLVDDFKHHNIRHLYLVTSDFHMPRAKAIGTVVLGSRGIVFTPIAVDDGKPSEPRAKIFRDVGRSSRTCSFMGRTPSLSFLHPSGMHYLCA